MNNVIPFGLIVCAQGYVTSGYASIVNATIPLFAVLVVHFATDDEALTLPKVAVADAGQWCCAVGDWVGLVVNGLCIFSVFPNSGNS